MNELDRIMQKMAAQGITVSTSAQAGADSIAGRIQASAERVGNTIPCSNPRCPLTRAHSGPCLDSSADPEPHVSGGGVDRADPALVTKWRELTS